MKKNWDQLLKVLQIGLFTIYNELNKSMKFETRVKIPDYQFLENNFKIVSVYL